MTLRILGDAAAGLRLPPGHALAPCRYGDAATRTREGRRRGGVVRAEKKCKFLRSGRPATPSVHVRTPLRIMIAPPRRRRAAAHPTCAAAAQWRSRGRLRLRRRAGGDQAAWLRLLRHARAAVARRAACQRCRAPPAARPRRRRQHPRGRCTCGPRHRRGRSSDVAKCSEPRGTGSQASQARAVHATPASAALMRAGRPPAALLRAGSAAARRQRACARLRKYAACVSGAVTLQHSVEQPAAGSPPAFTRRRKPRAWQLSRPLRPR
jgi:hypothetical protein